MQNKLLVNMKIFVIVRKQAFPDGTCGYHTVEAFTDLVGAEMVAVVHSKKDKASTYYVERTTLVDGVFA